MKPPEYLDCEQRSPDWYAYRRGIPTASRFADVTARGEGKVRSKYMRQLAGEIMTGERMKEHSNRDMERGNEMEPRVLAQWRVITGLATTPVGFIRRDLGFGLVGCSPDALVGDRGLVQVKTAQPDILIEYHKAGTFPSEHVPQCQGELFVSGREWCELIIGYDGMPPFRRRCQRDTALHARLNVALEQFHKELAEMVQWLKSL